MTSPFSLHKIQVFFATPYCPIFGGLIHITSRFLVNNKPKTLPKTGFVYRTLVQSCLEKITITGGKSCSEVDFGVFPPFEMLKAFGCFSKLDTPAVFRRPCSFQQMQFSHVFTIIKHPQKNARHRDQGKVMNREQIPLMGHYK